MPDGCVPDDDGRYDCPIESLDAGNQVNGRLTVRLVAVDETRVSIVVRDDATDEDGSATATVSASTTSDLVVTDRRVRVETELLEPFDVSITIRNAGPREARLTVEVVPPGTGDGGDGGELPKTGTSLPWLVATGLALVAGGSAVAWLARRRRFPA